MKHEMNNMEFKRKLPIPQEVKAQLPVNEELSKIREKRAEEIDAIFTGQSDKFILIIGPCSADCRDSVLEYMGRLKEIEGKVRDKLLIIPRIYTNKPRTTGDGYKGMLHQPDAKGSPDMLRGVLAIRELLLSALSQYGFTCADEMLYPENHRYLSDILAYVAVGARSVENQQHRLTASGLDIPVGMKNPTGGDLTVMLNSITAAQHAHTFLYRGWEVETKGNNLAHAILRGYVDQYGHYVSNYHYEDLRLLMEQYYKHDLKNPSVIIDTNHANSGKNYLEQVRIASDVVHSRKVNAELRKLVKGIMVESYLVDGAGKAGSQLYGQSITDPCLGWEKTEALIYDLTNSL